MGNGKLLKKTPVNSDQQFRCNVCCVLVIVLACESVFFLVTFDSLVMFCLDYGHCTAYIYSNLQPEYQSYVELYQQEQTIFNNGYCLHSEHNLFTYALIYESHAL